MKNVRNELQLNGGAVLKNRIVMAPMVSQGSSTDGFVTDLDLNYFKVRSNVAGMIITGAASVEDGGRGFDHQIAISDNKYLEGLSQLATTMKADGNKAIVQLYHGGREAVGGFNLFGEVVAPSAIDFPFLPYVPKELSESDILRIIKSFGFAAKRAIDAGFDGVEVHGANHYLIQQFFSSYSNIRTDQWGGSLENRMRFGLEVLREVKRVVSEHGKPDFIVGYRFCPDEIHGETIGFTSEDSKQLIENVVSIGVDYVHISIFNQFDACPPKETVSYGKQFKELVANRCAVIIVSGVFNANDANNALDHGDLVAIGRASLIEPKFAEKIMTGQEDSINQEISPEIFDSLAWPKELLVWYQLENTPLPPIPNFNSIK